MSATTSRCRSVSGVSGAVVVLVMAGIVPSLERVIHSSPGVTPGVNRTAGSETSRCTRGARDRRHPPRRNDAAAPATGRVGRRDPRRVLRRSLDLEPLSPLPRPATAGRAVRADARRAGLGRARRADRRRRRGRRRGGRRDRQLCPAPRARNGGGRLRGCRRLAAQGDRDAAARAAGRPCFGARNRVVRRRGAAGERRNALRVRERRLHAHANARRRRGRGPVRDRAHRGLPRARRRTGPRWRHRLAGSVLRTAHRRRRRCVAATRDDRRRAVPQRPRRRLQRRRVPGQPQRRAGGLRARLPVARRDRRRARPRGDLRPGGARARGGPGGARARDARAVRHLGGLRRGRRGRARATGCAPRTGPRPRRAPDRAELPRPRVERGRPQRDVRAALVPAGAHRLLVPERRARPGTPRARRESRARPLGVRLDRKQGRRLVERPARVVGGRRRDEPRRPLRRVLREPGEVRADRATAIAQEADPRDEERSFGVGEGGSRVAHGSPGRLRHRGRRPLPSCGGHPRRHARRTDRRRRPPLDAAVATGASRCGAHECGWARDPLR